jgi:hypothetical protein
MSFIISLPPKNLNLIPFSIPTNIQKILKEKPRINKYTGLNQPKHTTNTMPQNEDENKTLSITKYPLHFYNNVLFLIVGKFTYNIPYGQEQT